MVMGVWRWQLVLRVVASPLPFGRAFTLTLVGYFFGQILPGAVGGDAMRIWQAYRAGMPLRGAVNSVALERVITVFGLLLLTLVMQPVLIPYAGAAGFWLFVGLTLAGAAGIGVLTQFDRVPRAVAQWRVVQPLIGLAEDSRALFLDLRHAVPTLVVTVLGHVNMALVAWALALAVGASVSVLDSIALVPPAILVATLPISIAGWGIREGAMVMLLGFVGVSAAAATTVSVLFGMLGVVSSLTGGLVWIATRRDGAESRGVGVRDETSPGTIVS
jgi:uncharacterized membrane protein YbhN (UPF0104 family)